MILDQHYIALKTQVIKAERRVLKELGFCVHVKHPHKVNIDFLLHYFIVLFSLFCSLEVWIIKLFLMYFKCNF